MTDTHAPRAGRNSPGNAGTCAAGVRMPAAPPAVERYAVGSSGLMAGHPWSSCGHSIRLHSTICQNGNETCSPLLSRRWPAGAHPGRTVALLRQLMAPVVEGSFSRRP